MTSILHCLKDCAKSQHLDLLNKAATVLATHGLEKTEKEDHGDSAVQNLLHHFKAPLEHAGVDIPVLVDEWHALRDYGRTILVLSKIIIKLFGERFSILQMLESGQTS